MTIKKLAIIFGTRPEVIKLWPVIEEARKSGIETCLISTNQQKNLLGETLGNLQIVPDYNLAIPNKAGNLNDFLSKCITECEKILTDFRPDLVVVQGDTASALAGALSSHNLRIKVGHIEAGLRSGDMENPWPEEGYRRIIDSISSILWAPTSSVDVTTQPDQELYVVGNTSIDALRMAQLLNPHKSEETGSVVVTLHRRESFGPALDTALKNIMGLSRKVDNRIYFIQHPNPNVKASMDRVRFQDSRVEIIEPIPYLNFIEMISSASLIISDSGGLQEESTALGIPLLIVRDKTERQEAVLLGGCVMVGSHGEKIIEESKIILSRKVRNKTIGIQNSIFGDGYAARKIIYSLSQIKPSDSI